MKVLSEINKENTHILDLIVGIKDDESFNEKQLFQEQLEKMRLRYYENICFASSATDITSFDLNIIFCQGNYSDLTLSPDITERKIKISSDAPALKNLSLTAFSNLYFKNSKPLVGMQLEVLNETYNRLFSKTPTRL